MIVRKLRLQRGWSQDQLAELTSLSVRTIQRIERGHTPSLESSKSLASVFEVELSTFLTEENAMNQKAELKPDESEALIYAKRVKEFYEGLITYGVIIVVFLVLFGFKTPALYYAFLAVGGWLVIQGLLAFEIVRLPFANWERRLVEKRLGRKL